MVRRSRATSGTHRCTCTTTPVSISRPTVRNWPTRWRCAGPAAGQRRSWISRSSRTAWAVSWRAAHATMAPPLAMRGCGICARSCFSGHRITARRWNAAATGSTCCSGSAPTRTARAAREAPQRRHHRPSLRQSHPRGLAGARSLRARRPPALRAAARGRALLRHRRNDREASACPRNASLPGDGLVPVASALGEHDRAALSLRIPKSRQWVARGCGHLDLLGRAGGLSGASGAGSARRRTRDGRGGADADAIARQRRRSAANTARVPAPRVGTGRIHSGLQRHIAVKEIEISFSDLVNHDSRNELEEKRQLGTDRADFFDQSMPERWWPRRFTIRKSFCLQRCSKFGNSQTPLRPYPWRQ